MRCSTCGQEVPAAAVPPEPPLGTWVRDRFGGTAQRRIDSDGRDGWGGPGLYSCAKWEAMWAARGPLVECAPWGLEEAS